MVKYTVERLAEISREIEHSDMLAVFNVIPGQKRPKTTDETNYGQLPPMVDYRKTRKRKLKKKRKQQPQARKRQTNPVAVALRHLFDQLEIKDQLEYTGTEPGSKERIAILASRFNEDTESPLFGDEL